MKDEILYQNKKSWDTMADTWFGSTALPTYGCTAPSEDELGLFPNLKGKRVLDIGCGSGHSLKWCGDNGASELWGLDLSSKQIENAEKHLAKNGYAPRLFNSPMEIDCGLPKEYFDVVYSIYALGWTIDLQTTINNISSYVKQGGIFIFSWDHPLIRCIEPQNGKFVFEDSYLEDNVFSYIQRGNPVTMQKHKMSSWINALANAGFMIEQLVEETNSEILLQEFEFTSDYYSPNKAKKFPLSFIIKAKKL